MKTIQNATGQPARAGIARADFSERAKALGIASPVGIFLRLRRNVERTPS
jgi:hypothetical protein